MKSESSPVLLDGSTSSRLSGCQLAIEGSLSLGENIVVNIRPVPPCITVLTTGVLSIERHVFINFGCDMYATELITIGEYSILGPYCFLSDTCEHSISPGEHVRQGPISIGRNVWLGRGVVVLPGVVIGDHSVVAAGSIVTHSLPSKILAIGAPAIPVRKFDCPDDWIRNQHL